MFIHTEKLEDRIESEVIEFDSLSEYYKYLCDTPFNEAFRWASHSSVERGERFTGTKSFDEAVGLMKNGWESMAETLTQKLNVVKNEVQVETKSKMVYDVQGFQCSVPRYLQGIPTSMVNKKNFPSKEKVITINKSICYSALTTVDQITEQSVKALQIVKKMEAQGCRVNLNIVCGHSENTSGFEKNFAVKIRIKNANERLNISKVAFPLVNPSMLRRLQFRFTEVHPTVTRAFVGNYGYVMREELIKKMLKNEYLIPSFVTKEVNTIDDLKSL